MSHIPRIDDIYEYILDQSIYTVEPGIFYNAFFYCTAAAMGIKNIRVVRSTNRGDKIIIPNYFGITFAVSGAGKDHSMNKTEQLYEVMFEKLVNTVQAFYDASRGEDGKPSRKYVNVSSYFIPVKSSVEGIQKSAQTLSDAKYGSVNIFETELGNRILSMEPIFDVLKKAWDNGTFEGAVNVSDGGENYFTVKDMGCNALLFGAPGPFIQDPKRQDALIMAYITGMARRGFIYHNPSFKKSANKNLKHETMSQEKLEEMTQYLKELKYYMNNVKKIELPKEIFNKLMEYDETKQIQRERSHSLIAEDLGAPNKIEKLLGILAALDLSTVIKESHLKFAIEFTEMMDKTAEATVEIKPDHILVYELLEQRGFMARTDIVKNVKNITLKSLDDTMTLVEEYASMLGNALVKKEYSKIIKYKLEKLSESNLNSVIISVNKDTNKFEPDGFERKQGNFLNLHKIINSDVRYSAGSFLNNYINDENYLQEQNMFIVDVDDSMTIEDAKNLFSGMTYLITTTKSHQKPKGRDDLICDRFRIILPTISKFHLEPELYSSMYINVLAALGIEEVDRKCRNASRWYYGNPEGKHWYNEGELLDIRPFIPDTSQRENSENALNKYNDSTHANSDVRTDGAVRWFLSSATEGNRNQALFNLCMMLREHIQNDGWENIARHANSCLTSPLSEPEVNTTIKSASRRSV